MVSNMRSSTAPNMDMSPSPKHGHRLNNITIKIKRGNDTLLKEPGERRKSNLEQSVLKPNPDDNCTYVIYSADTRYMYILYVYNTINIRLISTQ